MTIEHGIGVCAFESLRRLLRITITNNLELVPTKCSDLGDSGVL
jgi:hypothetical protein